MITNSKIVIVGGGIVGCSTAYHLAHLGLEVCLIESGKLTSGSTWHAAGLVGQLRTNANITQLLGYSVDLYNRIEEETGLSTGWKMNGGLRLACNKERWQEVLRQTTTAHSFGLQMELLSPKEAQELWPIMDIDDVHGAAFLPTDGQANPTDISQALAKGARNKGANIIEETKVLKVILNEGVITGVETDKGIIECEKVICCCGQWSRQFAETVGVNVPLVSFQHQYLVTEPMEGVESNLPTLRDPDRLIYFKEEVGGLVMGGYEPNPISWAEKSVPEDFHFSLLESDYDHFEEIMTNALGRVPLLETAGIKELINGPESFTPDNAYHLGQAPELDNFWLAAGFNSIGIQSAGGAGMALSQWMHDGQKPFDLGDVDISRMHPFQGNKHYLFERSKETLGLLYADHFPFRQKETARGVRRSPFHSYLKDHGAVFGELAGWERANWFSEEGQTQEYQYSWGRQNWFKNSHREHMAVRNNLGMYDMSSFGKLMVEGRDAETFLNYICGGNMSVPLGKIVYTQFLNPKGGIEADVTVTRLTETSYLVVTPAITRLADQTWMRRNKRDFEVVITDVTAAEGVLAIMGPNSRQFMESISPNDFSNKTNPFGTAQEIEIGMGLARVHRVSYVGELGWEIYVSTDMAAHVFETIMEYAKESQLKLCGMHMMDSCRIEKGYRHFGHDITCEDHVLEAGLGFAVKSDKEEFLGRDAVVAKREEGLEMRMAQFLLKDAEPLLYHNEPIVRDGEIVGYLSSGNYGHALGGAVGMGYLPCKGEKTSELLASSYEIDVAGSRVEAEISFKPLYDPTGARTKA